MCTAWTGKDHLLSLYNKSLKLLVDLFLLFYVYECFSCIYIFTRYIPGAHRGEKSVQNLLSLE